MVANRGLELRRCTNTTSPDYNVTSDPLERRDCFFPYQEPQSIFTTTNQHLRLNTHLAVIHAI